jgi:tRNA A37 threonylcarbamoyladenosine biosynthesis protein TsaE
MAESISESEAATEALAGALAARLGAGDVVLLSGTLGAGKSIAAGGCRSSTSIYTA